LTTFYAYDAVTPANIPDGAHALLYADGSYKATAEQAKRFAATRWITVLGGVAAALSAGAGDYEPGNPLMDVAGRLEDWVGGRSGMGKLARVYVGRNHFAQAHALVGHVACVRWWIPTLDGHELTAAELAASIKAESGIDVPLDLLYGQQFEGGMHALWDRSVIYGAF